MSAANTLIPPSGHPVRLLVDEREPWETLEQRPKRHLTLLSARAARRRQLWGVNRRSKGGDHTLTAIKSIRAAQVDDRGLSHLWATAPPAPPPDPGEAGEDPAAELTAAGAGRRRLARELGVTEHEAQALLAEHAAPPFRMGPTGQRSMASGRLN
jgi:hypothetical protein